MGEGSCIFVSEGSQFCCLLVYWNDSGGCFTVMYANKSASVCVCWGVGRGVGVIILPAY